MKTPFQLLILTLLAAAAACGHFGLGHGADPNRALLYFTNESLDQATVYAVTPGGDPVRIGTVMPGRTDTLVVPSSIVANSSANIVARLLAKSNVPQSGSIAFHPGDRYVVRLPTDEKTLFVVPAQ